MLFGAFTYFACYQTSNSIENVRHGLATTEMCSWHIEFLEFLHSRIAFLLRLNEEFKENIFINETEIT